MTLAAEETEITGIVNRLCNAMGALVSTTGSNGAALRRQIGDLRSRFMDSLAADTFSVELLACFTVAGEVSVTVSMLSSVREKLFLEKPVGTIATKIVQVAIIYCLTAESRLIAEMNFVSRDAVETVIKRMRAAFDVAKEMAADDMDSASYQTLLYLAGSLAQHLASSARPLPRMVKFKLARSYPALALGNLLYMDTNRSEEIIEENHVVHPLFCRRNLVGLGA